jgi:hypothetical protein
VVALTKGNHDVVSIFSILHNDKLSQNSQYQFVNASLFYCIQLPSRPITFPSLLDSTMTSHPISSIFTELNAATLKTLGEKLTQKEFYETMPKVMNQEELDFLQASTLTTPTLVTESFMLRKLRGRREDNSEYPPESPNRTTAAANTITPPPPPRVNLDGEQYCYIEDKFVHTGPTKDPDTMCSYVTNVLDEKVPYVDLGGEMKEVPDNVQGMRAQFERVMQKMKEAAGGEKKRKANDNDCVVVDKTDEETLKKIRTRKVASGNTLVIAKEQIRIFEQKAAYADVEATINGFKRHFVSYMKKCRAKNKLDVARELLYQFMERNSVLLPVVVTDYIADGLEDCNKPELADLFEPGWLTPK